MKLPNLEIVEAFIRIKERNLDTYISQIRKEFIPEIRRMQREGLIVWYCFLIHDNKSLGKLFPPDDQNFYIHVRLSLPEGADRDKLISQLPSQFLIPRKCTLSPLSETHKSMMKNQEWVQGWEILGNGSEWVLKLVEAYDEDASIPINDIIQFMHYISNSITLGNRLVLVVQGNDPKVF